LNASSSGEMKSYIVCHTVVITDQIAFSTVLIAV
jgi:hypothetical protein